MGRRPQVAPVTELVECTTCGIPVGRGDQRGCAPHDCGFVLALKEAAGKAPPVSVDAVRQVLLRRVRDSAVQATPREAVDLLKALRELAPPEEGEAHGRPATDGDAALRAWAQGGSARPW